MHENPPGQLNQIINANLSLLDAETASAEERRIAQLFDRAALISRCEDMLSDEDRCAEFDRLFQRGSLPDAAKEAVSCLEAYFSAQLLSDKVTVCGFLARRLFANRNFNLASLLGAENEVRDSDEVISDRSGEKPPVKIAYFKNVYADTAFRRFSDVLGSPSVVYCADFAAVCEEVYYGRAEMCILPLDSSRDAKLISFCRLIDKYELKISLSCDVVSPDGGVTTRYALLKKTISLNSFEDSRMKDKADTLLFEFNFVPDENISLADVLYAAGRCELKLYKVDSIPLSYSDSEFSYDVILSCGDGSGAQSGLEAFALFMALAAPQYETLGVYAHLKSEAADG